MRHPFPPRRPDDPAQRTPDRFVDDRLGNSSYLVEVGDGRELVVDPARLPGGYLRKADRLGLDIGFAVETHLHADFVSGAREFGALDTTSIPAAPVAVMCGHGERATTAGSVLAARGRRDVTVLRGGPNHWACAHGPLATGR